MSGITVSANAGSPGGAALDDAKSFMEHSMAKARLDTTDFLCQLYGCLTPEMFGAKGDGIKDDTQALREALYQSDMQSKILYFPSGKKYKVSGTLNFHGGKYMNYTLNMIGSIPAKKGDYALSEYGGIQLMEGVSLFKNAKITGSIKSMSFTGKRVDNVVLFDNCQCSGLVLAQNNISNFGVVFYDTSVSTLSLITANIFLTVYYFSKNVNTSAGFTDSTISYNYINGGIEKKDNSCFEWSYYNGALLTNNFIDYYRTIYYPVAKTKQAFVGPVSSNNHYQVFRYLYAAGPNINTVTFCSYGDAFNWNDPSSENVNFIPMTYKGKDGNTYEIPPYVAICHSAWSTEIRNAKIERVMGPLVFVDGSLTEYEANVFNVDFFGNNPYKEGQINHKKGSVNPYFNNGKYRFNKMCVKGVIEKVESLPQFSELWSSRVSGERVLYNGVIYEATNVQKDGKWIASWSKVETINQ